MNQPPESGSVVAPRLARMNWLLALVAVLGALLAGFAWIVSSPTGSSPDDQFHLASIYCPTPLEEHCSTTGSGDQTQVLVPESVSDAPNEYVWDLDQSADTLSELSDEEYKYTASVDNGMYPGLYYDFMHLFAQKDVGRTVLTVRWVNFGIAALLFIAMFVSATPSLRRQLVFTALGVSVPLGVYFVTSINPTAWAIIGITTVFFSLHAFFTIEERRHRIPFASLALIGALLAAGARSDAGAFIAITALAVSLLHSHRWTHKVRLFILPAVVSAMGVIGYLSASQSSGAGNFPGVPGQHGPWELLISNIKAVFVWFNDIWDPLLGWMNITLPPAVGWLAFLATLSIVIWGLVGHWRDWRKWLSLLFVGAATWGIPVLILQQSGVYLDGSGLQVRYMYPLVIVLAGLCTSKTDRSNRGFSVVAMAVAWVGLVGAHAITLHRIIRRYTTGLDVAGYNLNNTIEWWRTAGPSPQLTWILGCLGFAFLCAALFLSVRPSLCETPVEAQLPGSRSTMAIDEVRPPTADGNRSHPSVPDAQLQPCSDERRIPDRSDQGQLS